MRWYKKIRLLYSNFGPIGHNRFDDLWRIKKASKRRKRFTFTIIIANSLWMYMYMMCRSIHVIVHYTCIKLYCNTRHSIVIRTNLLKGTTYSENNTEPKQNKFENHNGPLLLRELNHYCLNLWICLCLNNSGHALGTCDPKGYIMLCPLKPWLYTQPYGVRSGDPIIKIKILI
jgi:hypothetical protein